MNEQFYNIQQTVMNIMAYGVSILCFQQVAKQIDMKMHFSCNIKDL